MKKNTRMITLDSDLDAELRAAEVNVSGLCNKFLREFMGMHIKNMNITEQVIYLESLLKAAQAQKKEEEDKNKPKINKFFFQEDGAKIKDGDVFEAEI